ncbi:protein-glutamine gamma-glutamyltransferase [Sutcliffiella deserti]|uniref:protein-glutamine gamma-glutamyltransferase n=1 Tax=Sutcliffiella deserti TaxID=2875501 RepID=UPI001CBAB245|nr:protein-glutamine gamma-glutamyltransferase [Sutcliffiella deserti]
MIKISGEPFQHSDLWADDSIESMIVKQIEEDPAVYFYQSIEELKFEILLRKNILASARAMAQGEAEFETFAGSRGNPDYWTMSSRGGFQLNPGVKPSRAIRDFYRNSSLYAFECATAKVIVYYHAVLNTIGENIFDQLFQNLYLYSWHFDSDLDIQTLELDYFLPGDVVYFNNPDYNPETPWWRGENAIVMGDGTYFGHGLGLKTGDEIIEFLNSTRKPNSNKSAYMMKLVVRPSFKLFEKIAILTRGYYAYKVPRAAIHHNETSISCDRYLFYLYTL